MDVAMFMSVALGYVGGVIAVAILSRRVVGAFLRGATFGVAERRTILKGAVAGGLVALVPALLLGTVVGATLGSRLGEVLSSVPAGIALGVFAVAAIIMGASIALGACVARYFVLSEP